MPISNKPSGRLRTLTKDLFTKHEDHKLAPIGVTVFVDQEPIGQDVLDTGELVPIFEAVVVIGENEGSVFNVAQEELNIPMDTCPCWLDEHGCVVVPNEDCHQHRNLRHRLAGGEGL